MKIIDQALNDLLRQFLSTDELRHGSNIIATDTHMIIV